MGLNCFLSFKLYFIRVGVLKTCHVKVFRHVSLKKCLVFFLLNFKPQRYLTEIALGSTTGCEEKKNSLYSRGPFNSSCIYWGSWRGFVQKELLRASSCSENPSSTVLSFTPWVLCFKPYSESCYFPRLCGTSFRPPSSLALRCYSHLVPNFPETIRSSHSSQRIHNKK